MSEKLRIDVNTCDIWKVLREAYIDPNQITQCVEIEPGIFDIWF